MQQALSNFPQIIQTPRLILRVVLPTLENAETIFKLIENNRDYLEAWQGHFEYLHNVDDVLKKLEQRYCQIDENKGMLFGIYKNEKFIGRIRFFNIKDKSCEIGYWLIESENGNGFMTEALAALETELFRFGFDKIILDIDDGNMHSENIAKRNGYKFVKRLPMASWAKCVGKCDSLIYEKRRNDEIC